MINRRKFLQTIGATTIFVACKDKGTDFIPDQIEDTVVLRFAVASDLHWGEIDTQYEMHTNNFINAFKDFNSKNPSEFLVLNGDIIHNESKFLPQAYEALKSVHPKLYVTQGNHDRVTEETWLNTWNQPFNFDFTIGDMAFIFGTTSDIIGSLKCPNLEYTTATLEKYKNKKHVFIFWHIFPHTPSLGCTEELRNILKKYKNVRAVFNGDDHNEEGIRTVENIPYMFDGRLGGSWGSFDRNFRVLEVTKSEIITYLMTPTKRKMLAKFKM